MSIGKTNVFWVLAFGATVAASGLRADMLGNGGMEGPYANGLAQGWTANCYGSNAVAFAEETAGVHGGKSAQRVTCSAFASGGVQFHSGGLAVEKGKPYTLTLWLKGDLRRRLTISIRQRGAPYAAYLSSGVRIKPEWTPVVITGEASGSDADCCVFFNYAEPGTLAVDDVSLVPGLSEPSALASVGLVPQKGNRIYNGGFEAGVEGWTPTDGFRLEGTNAHSGGFCARVSAAGIECRPFRVRTGQRYTLSAWIRSAEPRADVALRFFEWADSGGDQVDAGRSACEAVVRATNGWARYSFSGVVLPKQWEDWVVRLTPSGTVWVDDLQIEEGGLSDYAPAQAVEVGAWTPTKWCVVGDSVQVAARVAALGASKRRKLTFALEDLWAKPVKTLTHTVDGSAEDRADFRMERPGMYRVRVRADDSPATGEAWFGVFPKRDRRLRPDSPFGVHVTALADKPSGTLLASEAMGARWLRLHDFGDYGHWYRVEPEKGRFEWNDAAIDAMRNAGFTVVANLGHPPLWAGRGSPAGGEHDHGAWTDAPPRDVAEWENYVFRTVEHYRGKIQHWEVWNEPYWMEFFSGTPEEYAELLKVACRAIRRADPQAVVIGGCFSSYAEAWTKRVLDRQALDAMDVLSYHVYWSPPQTEAVGDDTVPAVTREVERLVELMREHGAVKPIYMTEGGIRCPPFASWLPQEGFERGAPFGSVEGSESPLTGTDAAASLVRGMVQMRSAGVAKIGYYYAGSDKGAMPWFSAMANGYYVLMDYDGRPKPTMMAYSALESLVGEARPVNVLRKRGLTVHVFADDGGAVAVVWSAVARRLDLPKQAAAFDLMGNPEKACELRIGEPVYLRAPLGFQAWDKL